MTSMDLCLSPIDNDLFIHHRLYIFIRCISLKLITQHGVRSGIKENDQCLNQKKREKHRRKRQERSAAHRHVARDILKKFDKFEN